MAGKQWTAARYFLARDGRSLDCANSVLLFDEKNHLLNRIYSVISFCVCGEKKSLGGFPSLLLNELPLALYLSFHSTNLK